MPIDPTQVIQDLAVVMVAGVLIALLFRRLGLPVLVGYVIAGVILGPYTPPFSLLLHPDILDLFAQIGVVFLLLAIGLEYPIARLRAIGLRALTITSIEALTTFAAGYLGGLALGWSQFSSLFLGLALSVTSTVILATALEELGVLKSDAAGLILGVTIIEDVLAVTLLAMLEEVSLEGQVSVLRVSLTILLVIAFIGGVLFFGSRVIPALIDSTASVGRRDLLLLAILGLTFGLSLASSLIGLSGATGAFLAGVLVADSRTQALAKELVVPLRDLFAVIFFVSVGALIDFSLLAVILPFVFALIAIAIGVKFASTYLASRATGVGPAEARRAAIALSGPRGELSLVVAKGGADVHATSPLVLPAVGAVSLVTSFLSPFMVRSAWRAAPLQGGSTVVSSDGSERSPVAKVLDSGDPDRADSDPDGTG